MMAHVGFLKEEDIQLSLYQFSYLAAKWKHEHIQFILFSDLSSFFSQIWFQYMNPKLKLGTWYVKRKATWNFFFWESQRLWFLGKSADVATTTIVVHTYGSIQVFDGTRTSVERRSRSPHCGSHWCRKLPLLLSLLSASTTATPTSSWCQALLTRWVSIFFA